MNVITLTYNETERTIEKLIDSIDFQPDMIIGVLNGAKFIVEQFKKSNQFSDSQFVEVKLQRTTERVKSTKFISLLLKILPYFVLNKLRIMESEKVKSNIKNIDFFTLDNFPFSIQNLPDSEPKKILIVDDALDSGKTMYIIKKQLSEKYPNAEVKSAVIAWTIGKSIVHPEYYLYKNTLIRYPWSKDFKQ